MRRLIRDMVASSPSTEAGASGNRPPGPRPSSLSYAGWSTDRSAGGAVTTNSGSPPLSLTSTEPGARSQVISSAAAASTSNRVSRMAASRGAVSRSASARASSPPASAATASWPWRFSVYILRSMAPLWHHSGTKSRQKCAGMCHAGRGRAPASQRRFGTGPPVVIRCRPVRRSGRSARTTVRPPPGEPDKRADGNRRAGHDGNDRDNRKPSARWRGRPGGREGRQRGGR